MQWSLVGVLMTALTVAALVSACGDEGDQSPTPTSVGGGETTEATPTVADSGPRDSGGPGGGLRPPPEGADHIYLELLGGPDRGAYFAFYDDGSSFCMPGVLAAYNVSFTGTGESDSGSTLQQFTLLSPDPGSGETSSFILDMTISKGNETRRYELVPDQGKGTGNLHVTQGEGSYDIQIQGAMADDVTFNGGAVCYNQESAR